MIDKAPDTNELLRRIEALEKQARILPSEFSSGQEDLLHGVLNDRLKSQQHESRDHLNRGLNPLKITPGTNGQVLTTTTAAGQVDATWGKVTPSTGINPGDNGEILLTSGGAADWFDPPSAKVYCSGGTTQAVTANTMTEHGWNNTAHNKGGCTTAGTGFKTHPFSGGSAVSNYIQVPVAGIYSISATMTWYTAGSVYPAELSLFGGASGTTRLVGHFITLNTINVTSHFAGGDFSLAAGDKIVLAGYIGANHYIYYDTLYSQMSVSWIRAA